MNFIKSDTILIRIGLAFVYSYAAITMLLKPQSYLHYLPDLTYLNINPEIILILFAIYELFLSVWLLSGKGLFYSSLFSAITIFAITFVNYLEFDTLFRNVSIFFSALYLSLSSIDNELINLPQIKKPQEIRNSNSSIEFTYPQEVKK